MPDRSIIPRNIKGFNLYIRQTCAYLIIGTPANSVRYNWSSTQVSDWQNFLTDWLALYFLYEDKKGGYTTSGKNDLLAIIDNAIIYAQTNKLIELIKATAVLTSKDCSTWHLPANLALPAGAKHQLVETAETNKTEPTTEGVYPKLKPKTGGFVRIEAYTESAEGGRPRKLDGFDLLEYAYAVFYSDTDNLPVSINDPRLTKGHSSKASFVLPTANITQNLPALAVGTVAPAKVLVIFFRWAKSKHPTLAGPWCGVFSTVLL